MVTHPLEQQPKYEYGQDYQVKILALLIRYPNFINLYGEVVRPEYFENPVTSELCRIIIEFYGKYGAIPTRESLSEKIIEYSNRYRLSNEDGQRYLIQVAQLYQCDMSDGDYVKENVIKFARAQAFKIMVRDMVEVYDKSLMRDGDFSEAFKLVSNFMLVGQGIGSRGVEVFESMKDVPSIMKAEGAYSNKRKIPTPFGTLNNSRGGGIGPGEIIVLVGSSGQGKSIILSNMGLRASLHSEGGKWVAHATLELSETDNLVRYCTQITGLTDQEIQNNEALYLQKISNLKIRNKIKVKWFPPGRTTAHHIRSWVSSVASELGVGPCCLIVDYPDKMASSKDYGGNIYLSNCDIYNDLIALCADYQMPGYLASQFGRFFQYNVDPENALENIAGGIGKFYDADVVAYVLQSREMKQKGLFNLWIDKNRRGRDMLMIKDCIIDYPRARAYEDTQTKSEAAG